MLTDTHSHIHFSWEFPDIDEILQNAEKAKVTRQIIVGCTPKDSFLALEFVKKYENRQFWSTLGVHPHHANELSNEILEKFRSFAKSEEQIVAFGEIGLDYYRNLQPPEIQQRAFRRQLQLALELDFPVIVHVREAWDDALKIMEEEGNRKVILHCFTADLKVAELAWQRGYFTSFSGVLTYPKNKYLRDVALAAPKERLLIETDCPYLTPQIYRGQRNEPAFLAATAEELARIKGLSLGQIADLTTQNAIRAFGLR